MPGTATIDEARLEEFLGQVLGDLGAAADAPLVHLGDRLGLWKALAVAGPLTSKELAERTGTAERYVREWLNAQAASGYLEYERGQDAYELPAEHALVFADEDSPTCMLGGFDILIALARDVDKLEQAFRTGEGVGWHEHDQLLFQGTERFFRPGYRQHLTNEWIPALEGVTERLEAGGKIADVGCGHGASTLVMAEAWPAARLHGFDYHDASIERARGLAAEAGMADRVKFEVAGAKDYGGSAYDLVCFFDCLHDMGDPVGALRHVRATLAPGGTVMLVEPHAGDRVEDNLNPVGRVYYAASTQICTPASLDQEIGLALGAQAGEARLRSVAEEAGFGHFRRAAETPFNLVFELRT